MEQKAVVNRLNGIERKKMKCAQVKAMISRYIDGDLNSDELRAFELHVDRCGDCKKALEWDMAIHNLLASAERFEAPPGLAGAAMARIEERETRPSFWGFFTIQPFFIKAMETAFALLVLAAGIISGNAFMANRTPEQPQTVRESFSLDVFESSPPDSIGGIYAVLSGENQ